MTLNLENINSVASAVTAIRSLLADKDAGSDLVEPMTAIVTKLDGMECATVADAMELLSLSQLVAGLMIQTPAANLQPLAINIYAYLDRAIVFFESILKDSATSAGAKIN